MRRTKDGLQTWCKDCEYGLPPGTKTTPVVSWPTIAPGHRVRQVRRDGMRYMQGVGIVLARRHELVEIRDTDGRIWKIFAAHLEVVQEQENTPVAVVV